MSDRDEKSLSKLCLVMETGESSGSSAADRRPGSDNDDDNDNEESQGRASICSTDPLLLSSGLQSPEFLLHLSPQDRRELETKLKRKIDARLMPALIVMYILNYIDR